MAKLIFNNTLIWRPEIWNCYIQAGWIEPYLVKTQKTIRIHHKCEGGLEKSIPRITDWYQEACPVMTSDDHKGRIFLSYPHTHDRFFFLLTTKYLILCWKNMERLPKNPEYAEMRYGEVILILQ